MQRLVEQRLLIIDLQTYNLQNWYLTEKEISDEIIMNGLKDKKCYRL